MPVRVICQKQDIVAVAQLPDSPHQFFQVLVFTFSKLIMYVIYGFLLAAPDTQRLRCKAELMYNGADSSSIRVVLILIFHNQTKSALTNFRWKSVMLCNPGSPLKECNLQYFWSGSLAERINRVLNCYNHTQCRASDIFWTGSVNLCQERSTANEFTPEQEMELYSCKMQIE